MDGLLTLAAPTVHMAVQVAEQGMVEHNVSILPFKPKNWMMCHHQPTVLEEATVLMEAYALAKAPARWSKELSMWTA